MVFARLKSVILSKAVSFSSAKAKINTPLTSTVWDYEKVTYDIYNCILVEPSLWSVVEGDLQRWVSLGYAQSADYDGFRQIFQGRPEFRSLMLYRFSVSALGDRQMYALLGKVPDWFFVNNLYICAKSLGAGAYIEHGFSSIVFSDRIGRNFWLNQNVTIGSGKGGTPVFGDDCSVRTGAVVIGDIRIGDRVTIGANALVDFDVPDDSIVVSPRGVIKSRR